jgi:hypothetical protein
MTVLYELAEKLTPPASMKEVLQNQFNNIKKVGQELSPDFLLVLSPLQRWTIVFKLNPCGRMRHEKKVSIRPICILIRLTLSSCISRFVRFQGLECSS